MKNLLRWIETAYGLNAVGVIVGLLGFAAAMTPSLLPRPPLFTGVLAASSDKVYQYLNFDRIAEFKAVADKVGA